MKCRWDVLLYAVALAVPVAILARQVPQMAKVVRRDAQELAGPRPQAIDGTEREQQRAKVRAALDALPEDGQAEARIVAGVEDPEGYVNECCAPGCAHTRAGEAHAGPPRDHAVTDPPPSDGMEDATWHGEYYPFTRDGKQHWVWARDLCSVAAPTPLPQFGTIIEGAVASDGRRAIHEHHVEPGMERHD